MVTIYKSSRRFATKSILYFFRYNYFASLLVRLSYVGQPLFSSKRQFLYVPGININFKMFLIEYSCLANTLWQNGQVWSEYIQS